MYLKQIAPLICLGFCIGCAGSISGLPISQQNIERLRANAAILAKTSPIQVAYLKAALGSDLAKLPAESVEALDKIMAICAKPDLTDEDLGAIAGNFDRFLYLVSPAVMQQVIGILGQLR